jgi:hypothetical protein
LITKIINSIFQYFSRKINLVFFVLLAAMSIAYYDSVLDKEPLNLHLWRQTDCLSLTRNYAQGAAFLEPEMDVLLAADWESGKTAGEFPILYFIVGKIWSVFGESVLVFRVFYLLIMIAGISAFYATLRSLKLDGFWSVSLALLLYTSPLYIFYGVSFLTDVPAFNLILIALYFLVRYMLLNRRQAFWLSMVFFALAGLIKISSLILFVCILALFLIQVLKLFGSINATIFKSKKLALSGFLVVLIAIVSWYVYAESYNYENQFKYTFNNIYPIWILDNEGLTEMFLGLKSFSLVIFFSQPMVLLIFILLLVNLFYYKTLPWFLYWSNVLLMLGGLAYFVLWAPLFRNHDYYLIPWLILFLPAFGIFFAILKIKYAKVLNSLVFKSVFVLFLIYNFSYAYSVMRLKAGSQNGTYPVVMNEQFVGSTQWYNWDVQTNWWRYQRIAGDLKSAGLKPDDRVISFNDDSFNISLYFLKRKGWTRFVSFDTDQQIERAISQGAKYLLCTDSSAMAASNIPKHIDSYIGKFEGILVFKLLQ